jgi:membrane protein required for beta-lactamase induction
VTPVARRHAGRTLTVLAVALLLLDGVLLVLAGVWAGRFGLVLWGVLFGAAAIGVLGLRRRHVRRLDELAKARAELRAEVGSIARALHDAPTDPPRR